jgi:hypothetical protein
MKRLIKVPRPKADAADAADGNVADEQELDGTENGEALAMEAEAITQHPDGWYWASAGGKQQFGPFANRAEAYAHLHGGDPDDVEPGESLQEAEAELGLSDWIDPDTGSLAEGMGVTHLER